MSLLKKTLLILLLIVVAIQFYRPNKNVQKEVTPDDFLIAQKAPSYVKDLFKNSCYNCHSDYTEYYWYDNIVPAAWIVDGHIKEAKSKLNFSEWATKDSRDKAGIISEIAINIMENKMPLPSYTMIHSNAKLSEYEKKQILEWLYTIE